MSQKLSITVADSVAEEINKQMEKEGKTNRSEFCEDLIRLGLLEQMKKGGEYNGDNDKC